MIILMDWLVAVSVRLLRMTRSHLGVKIGFWWTRVMHMRIRMYREIYYQKKKKKLENWCFMQTELPRHFPAVKGSVHTAEQVQFLIAWSRLCDSFVFHDGHRVQLGNHSTWNSCRCWQTLQAWPQPTVVNIEEIVKNLQKMQSDMPDFLSDVSVILFDYATLQSQAQHSYSGPILENIKIRLNSQSLIPIFVCVFQLLAVNLFQNVVQENEECLLCLSLGWGGVVSKPGGLTGGGVACGSWFWSRRGLCGYQFWCGHFSKLTWRWNPY